MVFRRTAAAGIVAVIALLALGCGGRLVKQYEYEEEVYLGLDGSATVIVNASIPSLVALRGLELPTAPTARFDRNVVRRLYESSAAHVTRVSRPWRRAGRRFVQVRLDVPDVRRLGSAAPLGWSQYVFDRNAEGFVFRQVLGASAGIAVPNAGWNGDEIVGFKLHLPSKINWHNTTEVERGNILTWEQPLADRLGGRPLQIEARIAEESILYRTLWLFGSAFAAAVVVIGALIWWTMRVRPEESEDKVA